MTLNRLEFLERKFQKTPGFSSLYQDQIEEYMDSGYIHQLSKEEAKSNIETTNYKPHHGVSNINVRVQKCTCSFLRVCKVSQYVT